MALVIALSSAAAGTAAAQQNDHKWHVAFTPYAWAIVTSGSTGLPPVVPRVSRDVGDILYHADGGLSANIEARRGHFVGVVDAVYGSAAAESPVDIAGTPIVARMEQRNVIVQPQVGAVVLDRPRGGVDVMVGARAWYLHSRLRTVINDFAGAPISHSRGWLDGTVGARARFNPSPLVHLFLNGDVGAGASMLSWQATGGLAVDITTWCSATVAYRHLDVDYETVYVEDVSLTGPAMGFVFRF